MSNKVVTVDLNNVRTKRDIDNIPKIRLYGDYKCRVLNRSFGIYPVATVIDGMFYSIYNDKWTFEETIEQTYNISVDKLYSLSSVDDKRTVVLRDSFGKGQRTLGFSNKFNTTDYLLKVLRHLMTLCVDIEVEDWDDDMLENLKKYGMTIVPYGNKSLLSPYMTPFENNTYNYNENIDDSDTCLNITIKKKKSLKIDFHE